MSMLAGLDYHFFQMINNMAATASMLNPVMQFLSQDAEYLFYAGVVIYWFIRTEANRRMVAQALLSACVALAASGIIGHFFYRDRPFVTHSVLQLIKHAANASFPSDHATAAFVIATSIWLFRRRSGKIWLILAAAIAFSRVWTGVHYPSDVIVGAALGIVTAACVHRLFASSLLSDKVLKAAIGMYERAEHKVWPSRVNVNKPLNHTPSDSK